MLSWKICALSQYVPLFYVESYSYADSLMLIMLVTMIRKSVECLWTPGDPYGCTRQHSWRSGLSLPFSWIKHWSVFSPWPCCSLMSVTFSCLALTVYVIYWESDYTFDDVLPLFLALAVITSKDWYACPHYVSEKLNFQHCCHGWFFRKT